MLILNELDEFSRRYRISPREKDILRLLFSRTIHFRDLANELKISPNTVNNHFNKIFQKTNTSSKTELLLRFMNGFIESNKNRILFSRFPNIAVVADALKSNQIELLKSKSISVYPVDSFKDACRLSKNIRLDGVISKITGTPENTLSFWRKNGNGIFLLLVDNQIDVPMALSRGANGVLKCGFGAEKLLRYIYENVLETPSERNAGLGLSFIEQNAIRISGHISLKQCSFGSGGIFVSLNENDNSQFEKFQVGNHILLFLTDGVVDFRILGRVEWVREKSHLSEFGTLERGMGVYLLEGDELFRRWMTKNLMSTIDLPFIPLGKLNQRGFYWA